MEILVPIGVVFLAVLFALILLTRTIVIVKQADTAIVERLGRYQRTLTPGLSILFPVIDRIRERVDMREQVASFPPQPVITEDNLVVSIDTVIYFQVTDPKAATYEISSYLLGIEQLTVTTLRNVIGSMDLEQALTRARFAAGDRSIGEAFEAERRAILSRERDLARLREEVIAMRRKMHDGHPNRSALFDLKHDTGGMVDIEFAVQYLVLAHAHRHPELLDNAGNIALLRRAGAAGLIDADLAERAASAYREFRQLQHKLRLSDAQYARVEPGSVESLRTDVRALWRSVFEA